MADNSLISAVKDFRDALGLTQPELAQRLGKSISSVQRYEKQEPPAAELARLALLARQAGQTHFAELFKEAALRDIAPEIVQLMEERVTIQILPKEGAESNEPRETPQQEHLRKLMAKEYSELNDIEATIREIIDGYLKRATMPEWERKAMIDARRKKYEEEGR